jgi:hypothetical protein
MESSHVAALPIEYENGFHQLALGEKGNQRLWGRCLQMCILDKVRLRGQVSKMNIGNEFLRKHMSAYLTRAF